MRVQRLVIEKEGKGIEVLAQKIKGVLWCHFEGRTVSVELEANKSRSGKGAESLSPGHIMAPMPGKILKVLAVGQSAVEAGTVLVIMEAMKMEYSLTIDIDGVVSQVNCKEGQQVEKGQVLIIVEGE